MKLIIFFEKKTTSSKYIFIEAILMNWCAQYTQHCKKGLYKITYVILNFK
jgi:hypothetical protein